MGLFGKITLEAPSTHFHRYASRRFVYQDQRYWTVEPLARLLPSWTSSSAVTHTYSINATLVEHLQILRQPVQTAREHIQATTRSYQCLALRIAQEQARIKKQSRWFSLTQQAYLLAWQRELAAAQRRVSGALTQLQTTASDLSREQPVPLEIILFNTQTLREPTMLSMPLKLMPYSPATGSLWRWWFTVRGYYAFLSAKQDLFTALHLDFNSPEADLAKLASAEQRLRDELEATTITLNQARFYQFIWQGFLTTWQKTLRSALVKLAEGKAIWHERINARLKHLVEQLTADIELSLTNLDPDKYEYWTDEDMAQSQQKLTQLTTDIKNQQQAMDKESGGVNAQNKAGKALYNEVKTLLDKIEQRQQAFKDMRLLHQKKTQLGQLPPFSIEIPAIDIHDFDNDPFIKQLRAWEATVKAAEAELAMPEALGFHQQKYIQNWRGYLLNFQGNIFELKLKILSKISRKISKRDFLLLSINKKIQNFILEIETNEKVKILTALEQETLRSIKERLQNLSQIPSRLNNILGKDKNEILQDICIAEKLITLLASGTNYPAYESVQWLSTFCKDLFELTEHAEYCDVSFFKTHSDNLKQQLEIVFPVAKAICKRYLANPKDDQERPCVDCKDTEGLLAMMLILKHSSKEYQLTQKKLIHTYIIQQLRYFTETDLAAMDSNTLTTFEKVVQYSNCKYGAQNKKLQLSREKKDLLQYKKSCQEWLALLTQSPVVTLNGLGLLSSSVQPLASVNIKVSTTSTP